jgi:peptidoglycan hydrolase-like protein with peptidoglycan-binding domain
MTQNSKNWTAEFRRELQKRLQAAGYYSGEINGEFGEATTKAIEAYFGKA